MNHPLRPSFTRRHFLQTTGFSALAVAARGQSVVAANNRVRIGLIGCGERGSSLASQFSRLKDVQIVAISDPDTARMERMQRLLEKKSSGSKPVSCRDYRKLLEINDLDAVVIASPNHWHALHTIHACQAGKDVYVEKPVSHDIWEGRQMAVAAARYKRVVQAGTQNRSDVGLIKAFDFIQSGEIGAIQAVHGLCMRNRESIGKVTQPLKPPATVDYNLWLGPAQDLPMFRKQFHYDWHWIYNTGNGDIGNQGPHELDLIRWVLGDPELPTEVRSFGGRFGWDDGGETANLQTLWFEQNGVPVIFEVNNMWSRPDLNAATSFKGIRVGLIVTCEGGEFRGGRGGGYVLAPDGKSKLAKFPGDAGGNHAQNFIDVIRNRRMEELRSPIGQSVFSADLAHLANVSLRAGEPVSTASLRDAIPDSPALRDLIERQETQLGDWKVDTRVSPYSLGPVVKFDPEHNQVLGPAAAASLSRPEYRKEFAVPELT